MRAPRIALTGGIACGKSLLSRFLNELGVETLDADDIVHELVPDEERRRLAKIVFADPARRKELEARIHPLVQARIEDWFSRQPPATTLRLAVIPLLFEVHWEKKYDIIACVVSSRENQIARMMTARGYSREEAESRLAAQMPVEEKAEKSQYVIRNDGSAADLRKEAAEFVAWIKEVVRNVG